jgi:hypothetical protein
MKKREVIENVLMDFILKDVVFKLDNKIIKQGCLKLVNIKQFFIKFNIESEGVVRVFELPYPFKIIKTEDKCILDYTLSALALGSTHINNTLKNFRIPQKPLKFYNSSIEILKS